MTAREIAEEAIARGAVQKQGEFELFLQFLMGDPPSTILELGTYKGGCTYAFTQVATDDALIVSVDINTVTLSGDGYTPEERDMILGYADDTQEIILVEGDTGLEDTLYYVSSQLNGYLADLLFIDADHSYEAVSRDWEMYRPLVQQGGLVAFHDTQPNRRVGDVSDLWNDIKNSYPSVEFISDEELNFGPFGGIGVVRV